MIENFVTCFDSYFLPQGMALYESLKRHVPSFKLWVICLDPIARNVLLESRMKDLNVLYIEDLENDRLLSIKSSRSKSEYIWTLSPFIPGWIFEQDSSIERVTYLDADIYFFQSPITIYEEFEKSNKCVMITDHAFDEKYDQSKMLGRYCVQFIVYKRHGSKEICDWWADKCIEWCYARWEDGKYGDQKYLDQWPELFPNKVHILQQLNAILAPWNASRYPSSEFIAWHFHGFRLLKNNKALLYSRYNISSYLERKIYIPYLNEVRRNLNEKTYCSEKSQTINKFKLQLYFMITSILKIFLKRKVYPLFFELKLLTYDLFILSLTGLQVYY